MTFIHNLTPPHLTSQSMQASTATKKMHDVFFAPDSLDTTFKVLCLSKAASENDCLTTIVTQLCTSAVQVKFTDQGYVPFEKQPLMLIPYKYMNKEQILAIKSIIYGMQNDHIKYKVSCMMGNGVSVSLLEQRAEYINPVLVLVTLYRILNTKCQIHGQAKLIYNAIVQRLICNINLRRTHIEEARKQILASQDEHGTCPMMH